MGIEIQQYEPTQELQDELMAVAFKLERDAVERCSFPEIVARLLVGRLLNRFAAFLAASTDKLEEASIINLFPDNEEPEPEDAA